MQNCCRSGKFLRDFTSCVWALTKLTDRALGKLPSTFEISVDHRSNQNIEGQNVPGGYIQHQGNHTMWLETLFSEYATPSSASRTPLKSNFWKIGEICSTTRVLLNVHRAQTSSLPRTSILTLDTGDVTSALENVHLTTLKTANRPPTKLSFRLLLQMNG